ncbi:MAG: ribosome small subunit-dependent GTPase A [Bacillota bacterium]
MFEGVIVKAYGGFYYVRSPAGDLECTLRGRFRLGRQDILVGDRVGCQTTDSARGVIEKVHPRATVLTRPPIANINQAVVVFSFVNPRPIARLLDRILVQVSFAGITPLVCFNKFDLREREDAPWPEIYLKAGYRVIVTSAVTGEGVDLLRQSLQDHNSVLAGPSGTGKSSLLNAVQPDLGLKTDAISRKLKRGKHTTRHVELLPLTGGGMVADTPGFSSLTLPDMKREDLGYYFPEFEQYFNRCKFTGCLHRREPVCGVRQAVEHHVIARERYTSYLTFLEEVMQRERRY